MYEKLIYYKTSPSVQVYFDMWSQVLNVDSLITWHTSYLYAVSLLSFINKVDVSMYIVVTWNKIRNKA
jgi:hypothetical protein